MESKSNQLMLCYNYTVRFKVQLFSLLAFSFCCMGWRQVLNWQWHSAGLKSRSILISWILGAGTSVGRTLSRGLVGRLAPDLWLGLTAGSAEMGHLQRQRVSRPPSPEKRRSLNILWVIGVSKAGEQHVQNTDKASLAYHFLMSIESWVIHQRDYLLAT